MSAVSDDPRLAQLLETTATMTAPGSGGAFELVEETVLGERMMVFSNRPRSLRAILQDAASKGDGDCYVFSDGRTIRYDEIERQSASIAATLTDRFGIRPGDHVALCAANCPEWIQLFWALASLNAVLVAMNGWWTGAEMRNALELTEPALVVMDEKRLARLDGDPGAPTLVIERDFAGLLEQLDAPLSSAPIDEDDPFMLIFTSGTTGRPKAAALSHRCVIGYLQLQSFLGARGLVLAGRTPGGSPPRRLAPFPLFHVSGLSATVSTLMGSGVTVWPLGRFDPDEVIDLVIREGVATWGGASTHILRLLDSPAIERLDPSMILSVGIGGSASTPQLVRRTEARFPHLKGTFSTGYGSTETGGLVSWAPGWLLALAQDCVGPPLPTVEVRVTDEAGDVVADGVEGGIEARSPIGMLGYWHHDAANAETIRPGRWVRTGDVGRLEHGLLFIASRQRDLIIRGGENIYPFEIENRIEEHPEVLEVAVFGVAHDTLGQEVKAVVVVTSGAGLDDAAIRAWCLDALAAYKTPTLVEMRTEPLPRNATGKIMKHVVAGEGASTFVEE